MLLTVAIPSTVSGLLFSETAANVYAAAKPILSTTRATINIEQYIYLKVKNTKAKVTWSSSNNNVASVSTNGKVIGKKAGTTTITAKVGKNKLKCKLTVKPVLSVSNSNINIEMSGVVNVFFNVRGTVYYTIQDPQIVSCQWGPFANNVAPLTITGLKNGTTYVILTNTYNREIKRIKVTVTSDTLVPDNPVVPSNPEPVNPKPNYSDDEILARYVYTEMKKQMKFPSTLQIHSVNAATTIGHYCGVEFDPNERIVLIEYSAFNSFSQPVRGYCIGWRNRFDGNAVAYLNTENQFDGNLLTNITSLDVKIFNDL